MTTLYFEEEINIPENNIESKANDKELELAMKLVNSMKSKFEPEKYKDEYQDNIKKAIDTKLEGNPIKGKRKSNKKQIKEDTAKSKLIQKILEQQQTIDAQQDEIKRLKKILGIPK